MTIILEGPDGSGKSTLAKQLAERFNCVVIHEGPPPPEEDILERYGSMLDTSRGQNAIFDRLYLGERVYGPIYRKVDKLGDDGHKLMKRLTRAMDAIEIVCLPPYSVARDNWAARHDVEMIKHERTFHRIYDEYVAFATRDFEVWIYDYTIPGEYDKLVAWIMQRDLMRNALPEGFIGSPFARYLFVGDIGAKPNSRTADLPFFGNVNSSGYLLQAIAGAGFKETEIALVNSRRHDKRVIDWPLFPVTIALGANASVECKRRKIKHFKVPHPQFWRRFHSYNLATYVSKLRTCRENS